MFNIFKRKPEPVLKHHQFDASLNRMSIAEVICYQIDPEYKLFAKLVKALEVECELSYMHSGNCNYVLMATFNEKTTLEQKNRLWAAAMTRRSVKYPHLQIQLI